MYRVAKVVAESSAEEIVLRDAGGYFRPTLGFNVMLPLSLEVMPDVSSVIAKLTVVLASGISDQHQIFII